MKLLFLCPHNAAKSVVAAALVARQAEERGINVEIATAGTDPDDAVMPIVRDRLEQQGMVEFQPPRLVTTADLSEADLVINMGCELSGLPTPARVEEWAIPNFSSDPDAAFAAIDSAAADLIPRLAG